MICLYALWLVMSTTSCAYLNTLGLEFPESSSEMAENAEEKNSREALAKYLRIKALVPDTTSIPLPYVVIVPFANESSFRKGVWDLEGEMASLLSKKMDNSPDWHIVPWRVVAEVTDSKGKLSKEEALGVGRQAEANIVLNGRILEYDLSRVTVGDPMVGGYKSYSGVAELELEA